MLKSKKLLAVLMATVLIFAMSSIGFVASAAPGDEVTIKVFYPDIICVDGNYFLVPKVETFTIDSGDNFSFTAPDIAGFDFWCADIFSESDYDFQFDPFVSLSNVTEDTYIIFSYDFNADSLFVDAWLECVVEKEDWLETILFLINDEEFDDLWFFVIPLFEKGSTQSFTAPDIDGFDYLGYIAGYDGLELYFWEGTLSGTDRTVTFENVQESILVLFVYREIETTTTTATTTTAATTTAATTATPKDPTPTGDVGIASVMVLAALAVGTVVFVSKKRK